MATALRIDGQAANTPLGRANRAASKAGAVAIPIAVVAVVWLGLLAFGSESVRIFLPTPAEVWEKAVQLIGEGRLARDALASIRRVAVGVGLAAIVGIPLGIGIALSRWFDRAFSPLIELMRPIPIAAWVPLSIMLFGIGEAPARALIFLGALYPIVLNTASGIRQVDPVYFRAAAMLGAARRTTVTRVALPASLPSILTGLRLSIGIGWWVVILAELLAVRSGLGYLMVEAQRRLNTETIIVAMITIGVIGWAMNQGAEALQRRLVRWSD